MRDTGMEAHPHEQDDAGVPVPPLAPEPDPESEGFWQGTAAGELRVQLCGSCGRLRFPPLVRCPFCHAAERAWRPVSGEGTVWSFVVPHPPLLPGFAEAAPYNVVVVALAEDPALRMVGNLVARAGGPIGEVDPATIEIGLPVGVVFTERRSPSGRPLSIPQWVRRQGSGGAGPVPVG
jgi:uncharacterized protein